MELKWYGRALMRRLPIIIIIPLIVAAIALLQDVARDPTYSSHVGAVVIRTPEEQLPEAFGYNDYYNYLASEFAIDDLVEAVRANVFAAAVAERAGNEFGLQMDASAVHAALSASRTHRILTITASSGDPREAELLAQAAAAELEANAFEFLGQEALGTPAVVRVIDAPGAAGDDSGRARLLLLLQVIAAAGVAVLLAFLLDYLDDRIHDGESAAWALGLPLLAAVPSNDSDPPATRAHRRPPPAPRGNPRPQAPTREPREPRPRA